MLRTNQRKSSAANELLAQTNPNLEQQNISRKSKFRYLIARSDDFEKQIAELLQALSGYARRTAKLRDSGDVVAEALNAISLGEVLNPRLKRSTLELAKSFRNIQDHRDSEVLYLEDKLLPGISQFGESLQKQRDEVRVSTNKVFEGKDRGSSWIKSSSSTRRRSQSAERSERPGKEEKTLQQSIQRYELDRNLLLKKYMLKFVLAELRFTVRSFNSLTQVYKQISRELNPASDLKAFNEFFNFRSLSKTTQSEVEDNVSGVESTDDDEADNSDDLASDESGLEENDESEDVSDKDSKNSRDDENRRAANSEEESENSKSDIVSIQSTLRRFNSTPEIISDIDFKEGGKSKQPNNQLTKEAIQLNNTTKMVKNKLNLKKTNDNTSKEKMELVASAGKNKRNISLDGENLRNESDDDSDENDAEDEEKLSSRQFQPRTSKGKFGRVW